MGGKISIPSRFKPNLTELCSKIKNKHPIEEIIASIEKDFGPHFDQIDGTINQEKYAAIHPLHTAVISGSPLELIKYMCSKQSRLTPIVAAKRTVEYNLNDTLEWLTSGSKHPENTATLLSLLLPRIPTEVSMHYFSQIFINLLTCPGEITHLTNQCILVFLNHVHTGMVHHPRTRPSLTSDLYIPFEFDFLQYPNLRYFQGFSFLTPYSYICDPHFDRVDSAAFRELISILHRNWMGWNPLYHMFIEAVIQDKFQGNHYTNRGWTTGLGLDKAAGYRVTGCFHHWFLPPQPLKGVTIEHSYGDDDRVYLPELIDYAMGTNWDLGSRKFSGSNDSVENQSFSLSRFFPRQNLADHRDLVHGILRSDGSLRQVPYSLYGPDLPAGVLLNNNKLFNSQLFNWVLEDLAQVHYSQYKIGTYLYYPWQSIVRQWLTKNPTREATSGKPYWREPQNGLMDTIGRFLPEALPISTYSQRITPLTHREDFPMSLFIANPVTTDVDYKLLYTKHFTDAKKEFDPNSKGCYWIEPFPRECYFPTAAESKALKFNTGLNPVNEQIHDRSSLTVQTEDEDQLSALYSPSNNTASISTSQSSSLSGPHRFKFTMEHSDPYPLNLTPPDAFGQYVHETFLFYSHPRPPNPPKNGEPVPDGVKVLQFSDFQEEIRQLFISLVPSPVIPQPATVESKLYETPVHIRNYELDLLKNEPLHYTKTLSQRWLSPYYLSFSKFFGFMALFKQKDQYPVGNNLKQLSTTLRAFLQTTLKTGIDNTTCTFAVIPKQSYTTYSLRYISRALYLLQQPGVPLITDSQFVSQIGPLASARQLSQWNRWTTYTSGDPDRIPGPQYYQKTSPAVWSTFWPTSAMNIALPFFPQPLDSQDPDFALFGVLNRLFPFQPNLQSH